MITLFEHPEIRGLYIAIYENGHVLGSIYMEVDGFYVFQFGVPGFDMPHRGGFWEAWIFHLIADTLDGMNEDWEEKHWMDSR
jgi:hypothetical protein